MNWDAIGAAGEILGALAVLLTLIYVARQIRQSNGQARRNELNVMQEQWGRFRMALAQDEDLASLFLRGSEDCLALSPTQRVRFDALMSECFWSWANMWDRAHSLAMEPEAWENVKAVIGVQLRQSGVTEWWRVNKLMYPKLFREEIDAQASRQERRGA